MTNVTTALLFEKMNEMGKQQKPFVFLTDAFATRGMIFPMETAHEMIQWKIQKPVFETRKLEINPDFSWKITPVSFSEYQRGFNEVQYHLARGDSFLLNFTQPSRIETNLTIDEIFNASNARYKIHLKDKFTCFSPEIFVQINNNLISANPMKGTADASVENAEVKLLNDTKEIAEHNTIVDLIRNDLSRVADCVEVEKFRYIEHIRTNCSNILQVSSKITGRLNDDWASHLGDIFAELLPAGSVTGAPKAKTIEIIKRTEKYERGWYTGVFGVFDGKSVDSAVMIRFIEKQNNRLIFKSGGGITFQSNCESEYNELIKKVYVPIA